MHSTRKWCLCTYLHMGESESVWLHLTTVFQNQSTHHDLTQNFYTLASMHLYTGPENLKINCLKVKFKSRADKDKEHVKQIQLLSGG